LHTRKNPRLMRRLATEAIHTQLIKKLLDIITCYFLLSFSGDEESNDLKKFKKFSEIWQLKLLHFIFIPKSGS